MTKLYRILVVCTGNVCRSPMGEGFLNLLAAEAGLDHVVVESAGTHAPEGSPPTSLAKQAAAELGADIRGHRAAYLDRSMVKEADLILVMEPEHLEFILSRWPEDALDKVKLIRSYHPDRPSAEEVPDPIGAALPVYREVAGLLKECAGGVIRGLRSA
jgi:protein-tyrosine phosphatase